jgi:hypothetical protein
MITLEANYSKKIGLCSYSSHQFSVTPRTERLLTCPSSGGIPLAFLQSHFDDFIFGPAADVFNAHHPVQDRSGHPICPILRQRRK